MYNDTLDNDELLADVNMQKTREYIPVIVYVVIVIFLGITGNIMTVIFYGFKTKRTTTTVFISTLAGIDLATCVILSDEIIEVCFSVTFKNVGGCKFMYFINHWCVISSVVLLWVICIDRYRKICRPFAWQFTMKSAEVSIVILVAVTLVFSVRDLAFLDIARVNVTDSKGRPIRGYYCTHSDDADMQGAITAFHLIDLVFFLGITLTFISLYSLIGRAILVSERNITQTIASVNQGGRYHPSTSCKETSITSETTDESKTKEVKTGMSNLEKNETTNDKSSSNEPKQQGSSPKQTSIVYIQLEKRITLIMLAITMGCLISFTPYFIVNLAVKNNSETSEHELSVGIQIALRSFMMNSAINPYIIGLFNLLFRQFVARALCRCCFK